MGAGVTETETQEHFATLASIKVLRSCPSICLCSHMMNLLLPNRLSFLLNVYLSVSTLLFVCPLFGALDVILGTGFIERGDQSKPRRVIAGGCGCSRSTGQLHESLPRLRQLFQSAKNKERNIFNI